ncbi:MAG: hypothetical protein ABT08_08970 [Microbacterium sp. SCN 71-21]|uniref:ABC transporter permease n=1 Tax=Microbacterium sp. SCN 71-21 TaxID=1660116 RepID=UPI00086AC7E3|nr:hypothetical protein [Microbacterium sp. SCN 71-21]ODU76597.1 MAG: hypothetical protein ABT08_08970 [Microbacterium sp. SCN 71-21]
MTALPATARKRIASIPPAVLSYVALAVLMLVAQAQSGSFLTVGHLGVLLGVAAVLGIASAGQTLVIVAAGIDLSVGAVISASDVLTVQWTADAEWPLLVLGAIVLIGAAIGCVNALGISLFGINPMVMTLGMAAIVSGFVLVITNGQSGGQPHPSISAAMTTRIGGVPGAVFVWVAVAVFIIVLMRFTTFGRSVYAFGSNPRMRLPVRKRSRIQVE